MKPLDRTAALRRIEALDLPALIAKVNREEPVPFDVDVAFRFPYLIYALGPEEQWAYGGDLELTPLWTNAGGGSIVAYRHASPAGFIRFYLEEPEDEGAFQRTYTWDGVLLDEFVSFWEGDCEESWMRAMAEELRFRPIEPLLAELQTTDRSTTEAHETWLEGFRNRHCSA